MCGLTAAVNASPAAFLPADQAFACQARQETAAITVHCNIAPGYVLYAKKMASTPSLSVPLQNLLSPQPQALDLHAGEAPTWVYQHAVTLRVPQALWPVLEDAPRQAWVWHYQGCAKSGYCYPPQTLDLTTYTTSPARFASAEPTSAPAPSTPASSGQIGSPTWTWWTLVQFFFLGVLLTLTPCTWPMWPIVSAMVIGQYRTKTAQAGWRALALSTCYVLGMASAQGLIGACMAYAGYNLQAYFQHPFWIAMQASILAVLALLLLQGNSVSIIPTAWIHYAQEKLLSRGKGGWTAFFGGALSSLLLTPCTSAPMIAAVGYWVESGDPLGGFWALWFLGLGMGAPLLILAIFPYALPASGPWMERVAQLIGLALLFLAASLFSRLPLPGLWISLYGICTIVSAYILFSPPASTAESAADPKSTWRSIGRTIGLCWGTIWIIAGSTGGEQLWPPLSHVLGSGTAARSHNPPTATLAPLAAVRDHAALQNQLRDAREAGYEHGILFFSARWCTSCQHFKQRILPQKAVQEALIAKKAAIFTVDISEQNPAIDELLQRYQVMAPPTWIFFSLTDRHAPAEAGPNRMPRLHGSVSIADFTQQLTAAFP